MKLNKKPHIFVVGNEKGGAGKTTCSMHLIAGLLDKNYKVASIDADSRQNSLTSYLNNRKIYNEKNAAHAVEMPLHVHLDEIMHDSIDQKNKLEKEFFEKVINDAIDLEVDYIVIDTPGSYTNYSRLAHSYADTVITPVNDSFVDLDVMAKFNNEGKNIAHPSIYSQMLWEQKMEKASRDGTSINWIVLRNRLSNLNASNQRNVSEALDKLAKRISFKIVPGFSERVIFRELFPVGLTLIDLKKANFNKSFSISHVAARQELRNFLDSLGIK